VKKPNRIAILVHGGAGPKAAGKAELRVLAAALEVGLSLLNSGGASLDAVETAIRILEDSGRFNAGRGSRLQLDGGCRMDASLMEGRTLKGGAVAGIENVKNPIRAARLVMEKTPHVLMAGDGAGRLARFFKIERFHPSAPVSLKILRKTLRSGGDAVRLFKEIYGYDTVGAVARDASGSLAAGASTGGISAMLPGRVGDTPLIGSGIYADNDAGAVSMTGLGETIIRAGLAKEICDHLVNGCSPKQAVQKALNRMLNRIHGEAGGIVLDRTGGFALLHTSPFMCGGYASNGRRPVVAAEFGRVR
jgi:beta-aspartyl-peptidase (threonine type)